MWEGKQLTDCKQESINLLGTSENQPARAGSLKRSKQITSNWQIQAAIFIGTKRTKMFANCYLSERNFDPIIGIDYAFHLKKYILRL